MKKFRLRFVLFNPSPRPLHLKWKRTQMGKCSRNSAKCIAALIYFYLSVKKALQKYLVKPVTNTVRQTSKFHRASNIGAMLQEKYEKTASQFHFTSLSMYLLAELNSASVETFSPN